MSSTLLLFLLYDVLKMVTEVTETCRCQEQETKYMQQNSFLSVRLLTYASLINFP